MNNSRSVNILRARYRHYAGVQLVTSAGHTLLWCWLVFSALFLRERIAGHESWRLPEVFFPHIDLARPRAADPLRFVVQLFWLLFMRPRATRVPRASQIKTYWHGRIAAKGRRWQDSLISVWQRRLFLQQRDDAVAGRHRVPLTLLLAAVLAILCITVPLDPMAQFIFGGSLFVVLLVCNRLPGRFPRMLMIVLSLLASCRYIWWRCSSTLNFDDPLGLALGIVLLLAELYAWLVLLLGYFQNIWPLNRPVEALPADSGRWPSVDIFVPSYNENLEVVRATIYACMGLDWPSDKLNIYLLDDGRRDEFRDFARDVGVHYIRRADNRHAKAGNINNALRQTSGEFVAIFDCDHIPTRAFLQLAMGGFLNDPKLALVQTPHHFFSPDPFERNLSNFRKVPNEGGLFYGLIQNGNDLWNGAFFCGSCAIMRRQALEEIGGVAVETVTEDAHTSLRLHRRGYNSAYLRAPLAAGLATETLSAHIGQRIRWARGMAQILRLDNPLRGPGLKLQQRLCYFNAMLHFLSGIPRLIFLLAPLAFLLLHTYIIYAPALMILLYVAPHMLYSSVVNANIQGRYRHSFWGEVYETVLSWYIARPTTAALISPNKGGFNVTEKGGLIHEQYFDWVISRPYILLVLLNIFGLLIGCWRLFVGPVNEISAVLLNLFWAVYNLLILGGAVAVAAEARQLRHDHRVQVRFPAMVKLPSGHVLQAELIDFSLSGVRLKLSPDAMQQIGQRLHLVMDRAGREYSFAMTAVFKGRELVGLRLCDQTPSNMIHYVQCTFARADNWVRWQSNMSVDKPMSSMAAVMSISVQGYRRLLRSAPKPLPQLLNAIKALVAMLRSLRPQPITVRVEEL